MARTSWVLVVGYFVVFFAAMTLGGLLFVLGGVGIVLIPGALPAWVGIAYVGCGIVGSVVIALLAANTAFRAGRGRSGQGGAGGEAGATGTLSMLGWVGGVTGTVVAGVVSAVLGAVILNWLDR